MSDLEPVVLDTHVWVWLVDGSAELSQSARLAIERAAEDGLVLLPSICVWELAKLETGARLVLNKSCRDWVSEALSQPGLTVVPLSTEVALESCFLPGTFHEDPADRFIVATARVERATIVTRDRKILRYARKGYVSAIST